MGSRVFETRNTVVKKMKNAGRDFAGEHYPISPSVVSEATGEKKLVSLIGICGGRF